MAINPNTYFAPALTDLQGELTAKIGSMKSILALPSFKKPNIPKAQQISAFDYLLKVFNVLGIDPAVIFNAFLSKVFDEAQGFLEEQVLTAIADAIGQKGIQLSPYINLSSSTGGNLANPGDQSMLSSGNNVADDKTIEIFKKNNKTYILNLIPQNFLQTAKQKIAKDFMIMIFGPKDGPAAELLNPNASERETLISNAVCGTGMFSVSNDPEAKDSDIEYNRIKKLKELEEGNVIYEISCQDIKVSLPENPNIFFEGGGPNTLSGTIPPTPYQSLVSVNQYVGSQFQATNNESNSNKGGKSFLQIMVELLINYISTLVQPYLPEVFTVISTQVSSTNSQPINFAPSEFYFDSCQINNTPENSEEEEVKQKKEFMRSLLNALLKELIKLLLSYGIKYFKKFVKNYFAKKALEKQKRKIEKARLTFEKITGKVEDAQNKIQKYQAALNVLTKIIEGGI